MWATKHPIEVVVGAFSLATLAYFHALNDFSRQLDSTSLFLALLWASPTPALLVSLGLRDSPTADLWMANHDHDPCYYFLEKPYEV